jgi:hypothetical protein
MLDVLRVDLTFKESSFLTLLQMAQMVFMSMFLQRIPR